MGVIRSYIQMYVDGVATGSPRENLHSCRQNGYCEGSYDAEQLALDSCSYDSISAQNCNYGGQDGSACFYVCPDGKNHMCRMGNAYSGANIPECPSKPWKACADSIRHPGTPNKNYNPDTYTPPSDSLATPPDDGLDDTSGDTQILLAIRDTLHHANEQRKYQMYVEENIYDAIAGYGVNADDGIIQNVRNINANTRATQTATQNVVSNTAGIVTGLENLVAIMTDSTLRVEIVEPESLSFVVPSDPILFNIDTSLVHQTQIMDEIRTLTDTLVNDTPRTSSLLAGLVPVISQLKDYIVDSLASSFADAVDEKLQPFKDFVSVPQEFYDSLEVILSDTVYSDFPTLAPYDSTQSIVSFNPNFDRVLYDLKHENPLVEDLLGQNDSTTRWLDSVLQERIREQKDTTKDTLPLNKVAGDSAEIREKMSRYFLPDEILEECFDFSLQHTFEFTIGRRTFRWDLSLLIEFADMFGLDLCSLIRTIVKIFTFILIVFTTIKGYIRAFGGGDTL